MSLSSRWSLFSRGLGVKDEREREGVHNDNSEEIVLSISEKEAVTKTNGFVNSGEEEQEQKQEEQQVKTVVESSCNTENGTEMFEKASECHLKMRFTRAVTNDNDKNESNSHYKGMHTEVMPTIPVLFIEEFVPELNDFGYKNSDSVAVTDWRAYIYYDSFRCVYVLNATRRRDDEQGSGIERRFPDICMTFKSRSSLAFYLRKSMCSLEHNLSVTMYSMYRNVIHLTTCGAMPSFHSIHNCRTKFRTELFGYDDCRVSIKTFKSYLNVLKDGTDDGFLFRPTNYVRI
jgi:hypothetical protein